MSFIADKKREHETQAEAALAKKDYARAFFHVAKAADFGFQLAEQSDGRLARAYLADAQELLDMAETLKTKAGSNASAAAKQQRMREGQGEESGDDIASRWQLRDRPDLRLDDVAGLDEVKTALREDVILPMRHPEVYERFRVDGGGGVLMYGPPGTGKTFIARAVAGELDAAFFAVDASQIKDKYVGETEKNMRRLFEAAQSHERAVIFLDELDALLSRRGNQKVNAVTQFLILADGLVKSTNTLLLLGATNKPWAIDPAALRPGRFGKQIYVGLPDAAARRAIVDYCLRDVPVAEGFSYNEIARRTEGFSGADMAELCRRSKMATIRRQLEAGADQIVEPSDFDETLGRMSPSVSGSDLLEYEKWRDQYSPDQDEDDTSSPSNSDGSDHGEDDEKLDI